MHEEDNSIAYDFVVLISFQVPPADLEGLLLSNEEIADAAVIGVHSEKDATEFPRYVYIPLFTLHSRIPSFSASPIPR